MSRKGGEKNYTYKYDVYGNMTSKTTNGNKIEPQTFDALNRMVTWSDGSEKATYTYGADNKRNSKTVKGITTKQWWIGSHLEVEQTGGATNTYTYGNKLVDSTFGTYLYNGHGDVVQLVKGTEVVARYDYDAYGMQKSEHQQTQEDVVDLNPFRYAGEYRDQETKYVYLRARFYDTELGRFINQDPVKDGKNWHIYAGDNPIQNHNPEETSWKKKWNKVKNGAKKVGKALKKVGKVAASAAANAGKKIKAFASTNVGKRSNWRCLEDNT